MGNLEKDFFGIHQSDNFLDDDINGLCQMLKFLQCAERYLQLRKMFATP